MIILWMFYDLILNVTIHIMRLYHSTQIIKEIVNCDKMNILCVSCGTKYKINTLRYLLSIQTAIKPINAYNYLKQYETCSLQYYPAGKHEWYIGRESGTNVNYGPLCIHISHYMSNVRMRKTTL